MRDPMNQGTRIALLSASLLILACQSPERRRPPSSQRTDPTQGSGPAKRAPAEPSPIKGATLAAPEPAPLPRATTPAPEQAKPLPKPAATQPKGPTAQEHSEPVLAARPDADPPKETPEKKPEIPPPPKAPKPQQDEPRALPKSDESPKPAAPPSGPAPERSGPPLAGTATPSETGHEGKAPEPPTPAEPDPSARPASPEEVPAEGGSTGPRLVVERASPEDRAKILEGLYAQTQRRLANTLRDLAAARASRQELETANLRLTEDIARLSQLLRRRERELALSKAGIKDEGVSAAPLPSEGAAESKTAADPRFGSGGELELSAPIAAINGESIPRSELLAYLHATYAHDYWDTFVRIMLVRQEARRLSLVAEEAERIAWASKKLAFMEQEAGGREKFEAELKKQGRSIDLLESVLRANAEYALLVEKIMTFRRTSEEGQAMLEREARKLYEERFSESRRVSHIYWRTSANKDSKEWQEQVAKWMPKVREVESKLASGADFAKLAADYSQDENSSRIGGSLGVIDRLRFENLPELNRAFFTLPVGKVQLVFSKVGIHLVRVEALVSAELTWEQARAGLYRELHEQGPTAAETERLFSDLRGRAIIEKYSE